MNNNVIQHPAAEVRTRAIGAMLGLAVGDAVGTTLEFRQRDSYEPLTDMIGGGPFDLPPGCWTDDTSMALALADSLAFRGGLDTTDLMQRFMRWWQEGDYSPAGHCFDIGTTTRQALQKFVDTGNPLAGSVDPMEAGNGSLMRLAPIAIRGLTIDEKQMREEARVQSATTHGATTCLDACEAWSTILLGVMRGQSFESAATDASHLPIGDPIKSIVAGSWKSKSRHEIASSGYIAHSLEAALWCNAQCDNFREIILLAANLGHDADTTAAIAGQLSGARFGLDGIPEEWRSRLAWHDRIVAAANRLMGF